MAQYLDEREDAPHLTPAACVSAVEDSAVAPIRHSPPLQNESSERPTPNLQQRSQTGAIESPNVQKCASAATAQCAIGMAGLAAMRAHWTPPRHLNKHFMYFSNSLKKNPNSIMHHLLLVHESSARLFPHRATAGEHRADAVDLIQRRLPETSRLKVDSVEPDMGNAAKPVWCHY